MSVSIRPLEEASLLKLEADCCRAHMRIRFWQHAEDIGGAIGKMVDHMREESNKERKRTGDTTLDAKNSAKQWLKARKYVAR